MSRRAMLIPASKDELYQRGGSKLNQMTWLFLGPSKNNSLATSFSGRKKGGRL
jgi:hypothetical protein